MRVVSTSKQIRNPRIHRMFTKPRLYVGVKDEGSVEDFAYRHDRPWKLYREALPTILKRLKLPADTKAHWSQKAGCSCGCSPGFILDLPKACHDFYATLSVDTPKVTQQVLAAIEGTAI